MPGISRLLKPRANTTYELVRWQAEQRVESARRLAIYDQETGFFAPWYFRLRVQEECLRSGRYRRPLSIMAVEAAPADCARLRTWCTGSVRSTDLVCRGADGFFFILLTETNAEGASEVAKRLLSDCKVMQLGNGEFLSEEGRFRALAALLEKA